MDCVFVILGTVFLCEWVWQEKNSGKIGNWGRGYVFIFVAMIKLRDLILEDNEWASQNVRLAALFRAGCPAVVDMKHGKITKNQALNSLVTVSGVGEYNFGKHKGRVKASQTAAEKLRTANNIYASLKGKPLKWEKSGVDVNKLINHPIKVSDLLFLMPVAFLQNLEFDKKYQVGHEIEDTGRMGDERGVMRQWSKLPEAENVGILSALEVLGMPMVVLYDMNPRFGHSKTVTKTRNLAAFWKQDHTFLWDVLEKAQQKFKEKLKRVHADSLITKNEDELRNLIRAWLIVRNGFKRRGFELLK